MSPVGDVRSHDRVNYPHGPILFVDTKVAQLAQSGHPNRIETDFLNAAYPIDPSNSLCPYCYKQRRITDATRLKPDDCTKDTITSDLMNVYLRFAYGIDTPWGGGLKNVGNACHLRQIGCEFRDGPVDQRFQLLNVVL